MKTNLNKYDDYYSGKVALNLCKTNGCGDWHSAIAVMSIESGISKSPFFIISENGSINTFLYFGNAGIVDCAKYLKEMNIKVNARGVTMVAEPYRAVADMLLYCLLNSKDFRFVDIDGWLPVQMEKDKLFNLLYSCELLVGYKDRIDEMKKWGVHYTKRC